MELEEEGASNPKRAPLPAAFNVVPPDGFPGPDDDVPSSSPHHHHSDNASYMCELDRVEGTFGFRTQPGGPDSLYEWYGTLVVVAVDDRLLLCLDAPRPGDLL